MRPQEISEDRKIPTSCLEICTLEYKSLWYPFSRVRTLLKLVRLVS